MSNKEAPTQPRVEPLPTERPKDGLAVVLSDMPGAEAPSAGGPAFVSYCLGADVRAHLRRDAIGRAWTAHRRAERASGDLYPTALLLCQVAGVALQDLARLALAFESLPTNDPFQAMRQAGPAALDDVFERLADDAVAFRQMIHLPVSNDPDVSSALIALADEITTKQHRQWLGATDGWRLLSRISKAMRHGTPLLPRHVVMEPPGAGVLSDGLRDPSDRWVLTMSTSIDEENRAQRTEYTVADLSDRTLARARHVGLEATSLTRQLADAHAHRVRSRSKWAFHRKELQRIEPADRRAIRKAARRA